MVYMWHHYDPLISYLPQLKKEISVLQITKRTGLALMLSTALAATSLLAEDKHAYASDSVTVLVLATPSPDGGEALQQYVAALGPIAKASGLKLVKNLTINGDVVGNAGYGVAGVAEFASKEAVDDFFFGDAYQAIVPLRDKAFSKFHVIVGGDVQR